MCSIVKISQKLFRIGKKSLCRFLNLIKKLYKSLSVYKLASTSCELVISPRNLISSEYIDSKFSRYDTVVRYMAIEDHFSKNGFGFTLYEKMQAARGATEGYTERFHHLIDNVSNKGFDWKSALDLTRDGYLLDGSHRLALALYFKQACISTHIHFKQKGPVPYGLEWFKKNGFSEKESTLIEENRNRLFWDNGLYFSVILWPPVSDYFDLIQEQIPHRVVKSTDYRFSDIEFEEKVQSIYQIDDIADWKVAKKLAHMTPYQKEIRVLWVEFPNPEYRKKVANGADISRVGENLKASIRNNYKASVSNYIYDIICHTGDNWQHNLEIMKMFEYDEK